MFGNMIPITYYNILMSWFFVIETWHILNFRKGVYGYAYGMHP